LPTELLTEKKLPTRKKITDGNSVGKSVGNKKYYYRRVFFVSKSVGNNIFLLPTDLPTEKNYQRKIHR
jgi:hypothetical protein